MDIWSDLTVILPELIMAIGGMALLMIGVFQGDRSLDQVSWLGVVLMLATAAVVVFMPATEAGIAAAGQEGRLLAFGGTFVLDGFARFAKVLILIGSALAILMSLRFIKAERIGRFEFPILIVFAALGMMMMVSANDLITLYVGLELQSLALYVLASFNRDSQRATEAGLKYFVLGALSSGLLLYGASLIYGFTGTTSFDQIAKVVTADGASIGLVFGLVFLSAGLAFKVSAVPFHMWTPDVYEGAPTPVTAFFAAAPKIAAMALFVRALLGPFPAIAPEWQQIIVFVSVASMILGAFAAIGQNNIKRLMAYSSIGHVGFMLVGLSAGTEEGVRGVLIYLTIYLAMTVGTFVCILSMRRKEGQVEQISDLAGLSRTRPFMAWVLLLLMFSLAGIPPLGGFFAKVFVFLPAIEAGLVWLAVVGVVTSVVGAYYYLRIVKVMFFDEPAPELERETSGIATSIMGGSAAFVLLTAVFFYPLMGAATYAARSLFGQ